jgi:cbb3-type cytochrome oxidase subunit 1
MAAAPQVGAPRAAVQYDEDVIRLFTIVTLFWGVVAFAMGTIIAFQIHRANSPWANGSPPRAKGTSLRNAVW